MLRSWLYLDNHDTARMATVVPDERRRSAREVKETLLLTDSKIMDGTMYTDLLGQVRPHEPAPACWR